MTDRALGYVRVSTDEQAVHGGGLEIQREAIAAYCAGRFALVDVLADEGVSGSNGLDSRKGLADALARIEAGEASVLVVYRLDRLARDLLIQETTMARLRTAGCAVVSVTEPDIDSDDPTRVLVRQVLGAISQYERAVIRGRMVAGRRAKARSGRYVGGLRRYGAVVDAEGNYAPDPTEAAVIARARQLRAEGLSYRQIASALAAEGAKPRRAASFHPETIARWLREDAR